MTSSGRAAGSIAAWASSRRPRFLWGLFVETLRRMRLSPSSNLRRTRSRRQRPLGRADAQALRDDIDFRGGDVEAGDDVVAGALRNRDHAVGAPRRGGDQYPHPQPPQAEMSLWDHHVEEVVNRGDPREPAPGRARVCQAVKQVDAVALRPAGQHELLPSHPVHPVRRAQGHLHVLHLGPGAARRRRLPVDEGCEPNLRGHLVQRRNQLARVDLRSAGLVGNQVDEI